jgi:hypothetical protein
MEKFAVNRATIISALNDRDSKGLQRYYGRGADLILPIGMEKDENIITNNTNREDHYGLFVGSSIGPNVEGLKWFFNNVAGKTPQVKYYIVGSCCDAFANFPYPSNVCLKGRVDELGEYYRNASFVICPIFSGSGMKTKTIEALKYGKTILGTTEAFEGIDVDFTKVGLKSDNAEDYIRTINSLDLSTLVNETSVQEFNAKFTYEAVFGKFARFMSQKFRFNL